MGKLKSSQVEIRHIWAAAFLVHHLFSGSGSTFLPAFASSLYHLCLLPVSRERVLQGPVQKLVLRLSRLGRDGGWDFSALPLPGPAPCWFIPPPSPCPLLPGLSTLFPQPGLPRTLALGHTGGAIKVCACVSWTAGAEVLTEVRLIGTHGTADTAVDAGVVVMPRGALDCRQGAKVGVKVTGMWEFWGMGWAGHSRHGESGDGRHRSSFQSPNLSYSCQNLSPGKNKFEY